MSSYQFSSPSRDQFASVKQSILLQRTPQQQNGTVKKNLATNSPGRVTDGDLWKSRCNELESSLCQVNTELELANFKAKKAKELESRIDLILKQNAQLLGENDTLLKGFNQRKTESDIWKSKYENQLNALIGMKSNYELELMKSKAENQRNKEIIDALTEQLHVDVESTKENLFQDQKERIEYLKCSHNKNTQLYEEQVRKLQDTVDARDREIYELKGWLNHAKSDSEYECIRLNDDREKLRARIQSLEIEMQKQLEIQRTKKDQQYNEQILSVKKLHSNEIDTYESELNKLKNLILAKNEEIETLIQQNRLQKENFDEHQIDLKNEINVLKEKLGEHHEVKEDEITSLKEKLAHLHTVDINELKQKHEAYESSLIDEIEKLKTLNAQKSEEIDNQIKEKLILRGSFNVENERLKGEIDNLRYRYSVLEKEKEELTAESADQLERANQTHENIAEQMKNQINFLENQIDSLKQNIVKKNHEIDENIAKHKSIKSTLEEDIRMLRHENSDLKNQIESCEYEKEKITEENSHKFNLLNVSYIDKIRKLDANIDNLENLLRQIKEALYQKDQMCNNHLEHRQQLEGDFSRTQAEIERLECVIIQMDNQKARELEEQRKKLEQSNLFHSESLKQSTDNKIKIMESQLDQKKTIIQNKDLEINDIASKYDKMQYMFQELYESKDKHGPDYDLKIKRLGNEIVTTKNLYEVFVKTKSRHQKKME